MIPAATADPVLAFFVALFEWHSVCGSGRTALVAEHAAAKGAAWRLGTPADHAEIRRRQRLAYDRLRRLKEIPR